MSEHGLVTATQAIAKALAGRHISERSASRYYRVPLVDARPDVSVLIQTLDTILPRSFDSHTLLQETDWGQL